jgi:cytochrome c-type biogenesis protein
MDVGMMAAFGAGMLSFLSPCILPLVPAYLAFLAGARSRS